MGYRDEERRPFSERDRHDGKGPRTRDFSERNDRDGERRDRGGRDSGRKFGGDRGGRGSFGGGNRGGDRGGRGGFGGGNRGGFGGNRGGERREGPSLGARVEELENQNKILIDQLNILKAEVAELKGGKPATTEAEVSEEN